MVMRMTRRLCLESQPQSQATNITTTTREEEEEEGKGDRGDDDDTVNVFFATESTTTTTTTTTSHSAISLSTTTTTRRMIQQQPEQREILCSCLRRGSRGGGGGCETNVNVVRPTTTSMTTKTTPTGSAGTDNTTSLFYFFFSFFCPSQQSKQQPFHCQHSTQHKQQQHKQREQQRQWRLLDGEESTTRTTRRTRNHVLVVQKRRRTRRRRTTTTTTSSTIMHLFFLICWTIWSGHGGRCLLFVQATNSFLDHLLNSLSKLAGDLDDEQTVEHVLSAAAASQQQQQPNHKTNNNNNNQNHPPHSQNGNNQYKPGQLGSSHERRLGLYQHGLHRHYLELWRNFEQEYGSISHNNNKNNNNPHNNVTQHVKALIEHIFDSYVMGYDLEPQFLWEDNNNDDDKDDDNNKEQHEQQHNHNNTSSSSSPRNPTTTTTTTTTTTMEQTLQDYWSVLTHRHGMSTSAAFPPFPPSKRRANLDLLQHMFQQGYDAYMYHGWPAGEVAPLTCTPHEFSLVPLPGLTVVDALDTLLILGNTTEFARAVERLRLLDQKQRHYVPDDDHGSTSSSSSGGSGGGLWDVNQNVSVFETNIRVLGGLLSAHQMAQAWLPQVLIFKEQVFVGTQVRTGRDDDGLGVCTVPNLIDDEEEEDEVQQQQQAQHDRTTSTTTMPTTMPTTMTMNPLRRNDCDLQSSSMSSSSTMSGRSSNTNGGAWKNSTRTKTKISPDRMWSYDGFLLDLALDLGHRLLPAFATTTGIPYGTVHLQDGIPPRETTVASLAGGGTLVLEFQLLTQLTGQIQFAQAAQRAARALWVRQSLIFLLGKHIDIQTGTWTETLSGIGSNSDSFTEYMAKHYFLFANHHHHNSQQQRQQQRHYSSSSTAQSSNNNILDHDFWILFVTVYSGILLELRRGDWYADADMQAGNRVSGRRILESLMAFFPGLQIGVGEVAPAARSLNAFFLAREYLGFLPERFQFDNWKVDHGAGAGKHPLRPELLESSYLLHRAVLGTQRLTAGSSSSSGWLWASDFALTKLQHFTPTACGYAGVAEVRPHITGATRDVDLDDQPRPQVKRMNEMPSFFLTETLKYLYLTFDDENILHQDQFNRNWIFTTEAHPVHNSYHDNENQLLLKKTQGTNAPKIVHDPAQEGNQYHRSAQQEMNDGTTTTNTRARPTETLEFVEDGLNLLELLLEQRVRGKPIDVTHAHGHGAKTSNNNNNNQHHHKDKLQRKKYNVYKETHSQATTYNKAMHNIKGKLKREEEVKSSVPDNSAYDVDDFFAYKQRRLIRPLFQSSYTETRFGNGVGNKKNDDNDYNKMNEAHVSWAPWGLETGWNLRSACPNIHASELLWMHALHGGALDYVPRFWLLSTQSNNNNAANPADAAMAAYNELPLSTTQALAHYQSWPVIYPIASEDEEMGVSWCRNSDIRTPPSSCRLEPTRNRRRSNNVSQQQMSSSSSSKNSQHQPASKHGINDVEEHPGRYDDVTSGDEGLTAVHTEMGNFQIKAFDAGSGFAVEHMETGQVLTSTFVQEERLGGATFFMVHAIYPPITTTRDTIMTNTLLTTIENDVEDVDLIADDNNDKNNNGGGGGGGEDEDLMSDTDTTEQSSSSQTLNRVVIMADTKGNSFSCNVELVQRKMMVTNDDDDDNDNDGSTQEESVVVFEIPCVSGCFVWQNYIRV